MGNKIFYTVVTTGRYFVAVMAISAFYKNKISLIANTRLLMALLFIFLTAGVLFGLTLYVVSPYWKARTFIQTLQQNNLIAAEQLVPIALLQSYQNNAFTGSPPPLTQWKGDGAHYIQQVWPTLAAQQNSHQLLLLQVNSAAEAGIKRSYSRFPSRFRLTLGDRPENTLWFEWTRQSWTDWRLSQLCLYNPQPLADLNTCASSSR